MRKPIFDTIRAQRGKGFSAAEVEAIDQLLDRLGIPPDDAAATPSAQPSPTPTNQIGLDDRAAFLQSLQQSGLFDEALKPDQIAGLEALLGACKQAQWPLAYTAYALATAYHETAYTLQPVREAFWLSEGWRKRNLRYYPYYGRGYVQITWQTNYAKADQALELDGQLLDDLDLAMDPDIAARIMVQGMQAGWFAGDRAGKRHTLGRHLPEQGAATAEQFKQARRIINGTDKAAKIAGEAMLFQEALEAGVW